jgi:hypothetical protein
VDGQLRRPQTGVSRVDRVSQPAQQPSVISPEGVGVSRGPLGEGARRQRRSRQWNESPQAQDPVAFGLSMVKPCFSMVST